MGKYWEFFKASYQITFSYRVGTLVRFFRDILMIIFFVILWAALFKDQAEIGGFNFKSIVTYYILVRLLNQLYAYEPANLLNRDIKRGDLANYLVKPISYTKYLIFYVLGRRIARVFLSIIAVVLIFIFTTNIVTYPTNLLNMISFPIASVLGWILVFEIAFLTGTLSFWFSETANIRYSLESLPGILGGSWIPLSLYPLWAQKWLDYLPFKYLFAFPVSIYQEKIAGIPLIQSLLIQIVWVIGFGFLGKFLFSKGLTTYEAYGK